MRTLLCQSKFGLEFWGAAALYWIKTGNHIPHSSIREEIPTQQHNGKTPDISWFQPFGCSAMVFQGVDHINHYKISACSKPGVFICLGTLHGSKAWMIYCPQVNRIFSSQNVKFDETFFQLHQLDQHIYGKYNYAVVKEMRASKFAKTLDKNPPTEPFYSVPTLLS